MISQWIEALHNLYPEATIEDIADALWLASQIGPSDPTEVVLSGDRKAKPHAQIDDTSNLNSTTSKSSKPESGATFSKGRDKAYLHAAQAGSDISAGMPFKVPAASALPGSLNIGRALRPFKRRIPSRTTYIFDELATVQQIAEGGLWIPVLSPAPTRWFEIMLVVDASASMVIWQQTIAELQRLLELQGAFRNVKTWMLVVDPKDARNIWISTDSASPIATRQLRSPSELVDPNGQRLFLIVTDCVSPLWQGNAIKQVLKTWGQNNLVSIVQVLPQRLWRRTALGKATPVRIKVPFPGTSNKQLNIIAQKYLLDRLPSNGMCVPIVTLEPEPLSIWARGLMSVGGISIPGFVFDMKIADQGRKAKIGQRENEIQPVLSAKQRMEHFRATASPIARKLAVLVAAAPVSLPIIRLIQQTMLPDARQVHIAEFFLGGLLEELLSDQEHSHPDYVQYDFVEGVRELLLTSLPTNESMDVLGKVSNFIETHLAQPLNFHALLFDPQSEAEFTINERSRPFAAVATKVLWKLGGKYAALAAKLEGMLSEYQEQMERRQAQINSEGKASASLLKPLEKKAGVIATQSFHTAFEKLPLSAQQTVIRKIDQLSMNPSHPSLQTHRLSQAENVYYCRINNTRRLFYLLKDEKIYLLDVGDQSTVKHLPHLLKDLEQLQIDEVGLVRSNNVAEEQVTKGRVMILTAIEVEFMAVRRYLVNLREEVYHGTVYERGNFITEKGTWDVGIGQIGAGNSTSVAAVERAITYFDPEVILFVGVAGGVKDVRIGDVVAVTKAYGYESGKVRDAGFIARPEVGMSSFRLMERAKAETRKKNWLRRIPAFAYGSAREPRALVGPIAAGEKVMASTSSDLFQFLQRNYNDTLAVEMEGFGFFGAARASEHVQALIIRGISDLIANQSEYDAQGSQKIAASHAAAFAFEVLSQLDILEVPPRGPASSKGVPLTPVSNQPGETTILAPSLSSSPQTANAVFPLEIYYSFAHVKEDEILVRQFKRQFKKQLTVLRNQKRIAEWDLSEVLPGQVVSTEVTKHLNAARIILLFISPDYLASDECEDEMRRAIQKSVSHAATVIPILLRPVSLLEETPFADIQGFPRNGRPISDFGNRKGAAFAEIAREISALVENFGLDRLNISPIDTDQRSVGTRNEQYGFERDEVSFESASATWIGSTSPKNGEDLQTMQIDDVITHLKMWQPSEDFMGSSSEGLGQALASAVELNPFQFAEKAQQFQVLDPQFVSALFTGLEKAAKQQKAFIWSPVLDLCYWVINQHKASSEGEVVHNTGDPVWAWSCRTITYLLSTGLEPNTTEIPFELRKKVWEVLQVLTYDQEPTIEDEARYGGSNMEPATLAINTTRGMAMQTVVRYALWVRRHLELEYDGKERVARGFDEMPEARFVLAWHLDSINDPSLAVHSVYGQFFPWLLLLDPQWTTKNLAKIFCEEEAIRERRDAAWETYIVFCNTYDNVFDVLRSEYLRSIEFIRTSSSERQYLEKPEGRLAEHLMVFYWRGKLDLDDPERFLSRFFAKAPDQLRAHALEFVGHSLRNSEKPISTQVLERLKALWEWRVKVGSNTAQRASHINEFSAFGWWFSSKRFDETWAIAQLERALQQNGSIEALHLVVEYLAELSSRMPLLVLECLGLLVQGSSETWWITSLREHVHRILTNALNNQDLKGQQGAKDLIDRLAANGYSEFLDLIPERHPIADKIKGTYEDVTEKSSAKKLLPAILIGGPPHTGKSVLVYGLAAALRERGIQHHVIHAVPDGEGNWSQESNPETVRRIRITGSWSDEFVKRICLDLERRHLPLLVDIGGRPNESQARILRQCTHAILLLRADREEDNQLWLRLIQENGLLPIAQIHSRLNGTSTLASQNPVIEGTITGLIRGNNITTNPVFDSLIERIAVLFGSYSTEELVKYVFDSAPTALVIDLPASLRAFAPSKQLWEPEMLQPFLSSLSIDTPLSVRGVGPNWLYAALAAYAHPQPFYQFDPRLPFGWIQPPPVHIGSAQSSEILVQTHAYQDINVLSITIPSQHLEFSEEKSLPFPSVNTDAGLIINGKIPFWLLTALVMLYKEAGVPWIATYNVPYDKSVVVYSGVEGYNLGDLIYLPIP